MPSISQVKLQVNFASYIARYTGGLVPSSRAGRWYLGYCPFCQAEHRGRRRFWVDVDRGLCNCFKPGCMSDKPMDVINFLTRYKGITPAEAVQELCQTI